MANKLTAVWVGAAGICRLVLLAAAGGRGPPWLHFLLAAPGLAVGLKSRPACWTAACSCRRGWQLPPANFRGQGVHSAGKPVSARQAGGAKECAGSQRAHAPQQTIHPKPEPVCTPATRSNQEAQNSSVQALPAPHPLSLQHAAGSAARVHMLLPRRCCRAWCRGSAPASGGAPRRRSRCAPAWRTAPGQGPKGRRYEWVRTGWLFQPAGCTVCQLGRQHLGRRMRLCKQTVAWARRQGKSATSPGASLPCTSPARPTAASALQGQSVSSHSPSSG